jgi:hypothetical protein
MLKEDCAVAEARWEDAPRWVVETGVQEKWGEREWRNLELLKARFKELGVELEPGGNPPTDLRHVYAYWKNGGWVAGVELNRDHPTPLHEGLHELVNQVAEMVRRRAQSQSDR